MSQMLLSALFGQGEQPLILGESGSLSPAILMRQAAVIAAQLPDATPGSEVAFSFERDRAACTAALIATWAKGHTAALPENGTKETIVPLLRRENNVAFLHDTGVGMGTHVPTLLEEAPLGDAAEWSAVADDHSRIAAFKQPASGESQLVRWTEAELLSDLTTLAEQMSVAAGTHVACSMTPTALPGLLLGLLVPALRGATFEQVTASDTEALALQIRERNASTLIVTPAHARALSRLAPGQLEPLATFYCVDEGLDLRSVRRFQSDHGIEQLETPRLPLDLDSSAIVRSLTEALLSHEQVDDADVALLDDETRIFVTVVGQNSYMEACRAIVDQHLSSEIASELAPRASLPRDANGRLEKWQTLLNFGYGRAEKPLEPSLSWTQLASQEPENWRFQCRLPENYSFFEGHYTSYAVLAGAVQIHELALPCIRRIEPAARLLKRLTGLKFMSRIAPCDEVIVSVMRSPKAGEFRFEITVSEVRCSAGTLQFVVCAEEKAQ